VKCFTRRSIFFARQPSLCFSERLSVSEGAKCRSRIFSWALALDFQLAIECKECCWWRRVRWDCTAVERDHGISVCSAVMSFENEGLAFNLLDTPGHQNFSENAM